MFISRQSFTNFLTIPLKLYFSKKFCVAGRNVNQPVTHLWKFSSLWSVEWIFSLLIQTKLSQLLRQRISTEQSPHKLRFVMNKNLYALHYQCLKWIYRYLWYHSFSCSVGYWLFNDIELETVSIVGMEVLILMPYTFLERYPYYIPGITFCQLILPF